MSVCRLFVGRTEKSISQIISELQESCQLLDDTITMWFQPRPRREKILAKTFGPLTELRPTEINSIEMEEACCWGNGWQLTIYRRTKTESQVAFWISRNSPHFDTEMNLLPLLESAESKGQFEMLAGEKKISFDQGEHFQTVTTYSTDQKLRWFHFEPVESSTPVTEASNVTA